MSNSSDKLISREILNSLGKNRSCGCKGIRTCLLCEKLFIDHGNNTIRNHSNSKPKDCYTFCSLCGTKAWIIDDHRFHVTNRDDDATPTTSLTPANTCTTATNNSNNANHSRQYVSIGGVTVIENVISELEEEYIIRQIDDPGTPSKWTVSQSGRRKQDYGPKVNFRKKKVKLANFQGLPDYGHKLFQKVQKLTHLLDDFVPVELCNLEYVPERGSSIDPHLDDDWLWGERLVTVNLISSTKLTLSSVKCSTYADDDVDDTVEIDIPLPPRSLLILYGEARYKWYHAIKRQNITSRRIGITLRELTPLFLPNGQHYEQIGEQILEIAKKELSC